MFDETTFLYYKEEKISVKRCKIIFYKCRNNT